MNNRVISSSLISLAVVLSSCGKPVPVELPSDIKNAARNIASANTTSNTNTVNIPKDSRISNSPDINENQIVYYHNGEDPAAKPIENSKSSSSSTVQTNIKDSVALDLKQTTGSEDAANDAIDDINLDDMDDAFDDAGEIDTGAEDSLDDHTDSSVTQSEGYKYIDLRAPAPGGVSYSSPLKLDIRYKKLFHNTLTKEMSVILDGKDITEQVKGGGLKYQWTATINDLQPGEHKLSFVIDNKNKDTYDYKFSYMTQKPIERISSLADSAIKRFDPTKMKWDWGEGLFLYSLARLDQYKRETKYQNFIKSYYDNYIQKGIPEINWSDRTAPALAALELYKQTGDEKYKKIGTDAINYLKAAKKTSYGGFNHFGTHFFSKIYPESMWVDSLMMYNVFAARWGNFMSDPEMTSFASEQPVLFSKVLQKPETKLWKHAWLTKFKRNIPESEAYWLRGNGWVMASLPETIDMLPGNNPNRAQLISIFNRTAEGLLKYQSDIGMWHTVINKQGKVYLESSGTALVSYGMLRGVHKGYLPGNFREPAVKAFYSLLDRFENDNYGLSMPEISHNTMPYSFLGYKLVPQKNDLSFGLAAMILAGIEYDSGFMN